MPRFDAAVPPRNRRRPALALAVRYIAAATLLHALWEAGQLPLYTLWSTGTRLEVFLAAAHCTGGDLLITVSTLTIAAAFTRLCHRPLFDRRMAVATIIFGVAYTILSEWLNVNLWRTWAYAPAMPVLPGTGMGLAPLLQWLIVPSLGFAITFAHRGPRRSRRRLLETQREP